MSSKGSGTWRHVPLDEYIDAMYTAFDLPNTCDLCCYWFELARRIIERNSNVRVGLLATQGIRGGSNRTVLERIKKTGDIFMAWSDRKWILDGAAVHVSIIGFDAGGETRRVLDDNPVERINADLTGNVDASQARPLTENRDIAYMGDTKGGKFDVSCREARQILGAPNPQGRPNSGVVRPWVNGGDITKRNRAMWIVDFGCDLAKSQAAQYEVPFRLVEERVWPTRRHNRRKTYA